MGAAVLTSDAYAVSLATFRSVSSRRSAYLLTCSLAPTFTHLLAHVLTYLLMYLLTYLLVCLLTFSALSLRLDASPAGPTGVTTLRKVQ